MAKLFHFSLGTLRKPLGMSKESLEDDIEDSLSLNGNQ